MGTHLITTPFEWPQWTGPPPVVAQVHAILYTSIAISLLALLLTPLVMIQWLPECTGVDPGAPRIERPKSQQSIRQLLPMSSVSTSSIKRTQDRQRKLDRISHVMGSLPLMLQAALLLRVCALSRYFLETNPTVASAAINLTYFCAILYLYIVIVGVILPFWSYQAPGACNPHRLVHIPGLLHSFFSTFTERSTCRHFISMLWDGLKGNHPSEMRFVSTEPDLVTVCLHFLILPFCLLGDVAHLCMDIVWPFIVFVRRAFFRLLQGPEQQATMVDQYCISWTLRTLPDVPARLSALNYLATITLGHFDPTIVIDCFDTLIGCVKVTDGKVMVIQGQEQLATVSALCCLHTLSHLAVVDTIVSVEGVRQRYTKVFPSEAKFDNLPFSHTLGAIHTVFYQTRKFRVGFPGRADQTTLVTWRAWLAWQDQWWEDGKPSNDERVAVARALRGHGHHPWRVQWNDYEPSSDEHIVVACALAKLARFEYKRRGHRKVPRWLLRFAFHSLSQYPLPPTPVIVNCLTIIAIDLGCSLPNARTPYNRYVYTRQICTSLTNCQYATRRRFLPYYSETRKHG